MKRLFVSVALLPLLHAAQASAETKISTATTAPVATSTAASGQPDDLTIETAGSIKPAAAGAAVTLDSDNKVSNAGEISFNGLDNSTGILVLGGHSGAVTNSGVISLLEDYTPADADADGDPDGPQAKGTGRFGIRVTGPTAFTGDITSSGAITVEGNDSGGLVVAPRLVGALVSSGAISVLGDRTVGLSATSVSGDVKVLGAVSAQGDAAVGVSLGDVDGGVRLQNAITATGYRTATRVSDDTARAKLDADDLLQGGAAVRITGSVGKGVLLDRPPADLDTANKDEDGDGIDDAAEGTASLTSAGSAPALDIGSALATSIGAVGTGINAFGLVNRGAIAADGVNDGVSATAVRIGQAGGGTTTVAGGISNQGGTITAKAYGGQATALLINAGAVTPTLVNDGSIAASQAGGLHDARAVVDLSGTLTGVWNTGAIGASVVPKSGVTATGHAVAIDLSANTTGVVVHQTKATSTGTPSIKGEVRLGSGDDRLELVGGTLDGDMSFGAGADTLMIDGAAQAAGRITDADGRLGIEVREGRLAVDNAEGVQVSSLTLGAKGVLAVTIDGAKNTATRFDVSGVADIATGAQFDLNLASLVRGAKSYEIVRAGTLQIGAVGATLVGAPYLYTASLRSDSASNSLVVDVKAKTAAELGLNRSGSQAYAAVFDNLDKDAAIESAFLAQTTKAGFTDLYDQMLPDHSGAALMSVQSASQAISQAAGQPVNRESFGGTGVWAQEILLHIDRDRDQALGFRSDGFGLAAGVELAGAANAVGLNTAFVTTTYKDRGAASGERVAMNLLEGGAYWRLQAGGFSADARGGLGYVRFDSERKFSGAGVNLTAGADWTGWLAEAHLGAAYEVRAGWVYARPELSADYLRLSEGDYQESGGGAGFDLDVEKRKSDLLTGQALLTVGARFGDEVYWAPELKVGWRAKLAGAPGSTTARFAGGTAFTLDPEAAYSGGAVARLGVKGGTRSVLYAVEGGGVFDDGYQEYDLRAVVKVLF